ncbi:MAG TPA: MerR family DNA-binding transcriptional regulator, partial [Mycobacteriales bacterium]|nr:MerR family DNA-binding transcriptional regulator [Mycobacteriales bacterium]
MRGVDLARATGMSVQQVRNYEQAGLLPAADRTDSGHRIFTATHQHALSAARALVRAYGWDEAVAVMTAVHSGDLPQAFVHLDGGHARLDRERQQIWQALQAFELVVTQPGDSELDSAVARIQRQGAPLRVGQVAQLLGV